MPQQHQPGLEASRRVARLLCIVYIGILDGLGINTQTKKIPSTSCYLGCHHCPDLGLVFLLQIILRKPWVGLPGSFCSSQFQMQPV